jgi:hypothetical protein
MYRSMLGFVCVCACCTCLECLLVQPLVPVQAPDQAAEPVTGLVRFVDGWERVLAHGNMNRVSSRQLLPSFAVKRHPRVASGIVWDLIQNKRVSQLSHQDVLDTYAYHAFILKAEIKT